MCKGFVVYARWKLVNDANKIILLVQSNGPFAYKMSYKAVSVANPCTNRPVPCQICLSTTGSELALFRAHAVCVELPLFRAHAVYAPRSDIDRGGGGYESMSFIVQRLCSKGAGEEAHDGPHQDVTNPSLLEQRDMGSFPRKGT